MKLSSLVPSVIAAAGVAVAASMMPAEAATVGFQNIFPNGGNTNGDSIVNQFSIDVTDAGNSQALFKFSNAGPVGSSITQIYWDDATDALSSIFGIDVGTTSPGVSYTVSNNPGNLPQGNNINFNEEFKVQATNQGGVSNNGVNINEMLGVLFNYSGSFGDVETALNSGSLRIGMHVQSIDSANDGSDSFVNTPGTNEPVPEPLTILGSATALGIGGLLKRQQSKKNNKA